MPVSSCQTEATNWYAHGLIPGLATGELATGNWQLTSTHTSTTCHRDIRYAARGLWRDRAFTASTVATLTVAIALVAVVFTIFNAYVLRPYAVRDPYSLYEVRWHSRPVGQRSRTRWAQSGRTFRWSDYQELQRRRDVFDAVIAERNRSVISDGTPLLAAFVSGNYFETLGGRVRLGRSLAELRRAVTGRRCVVVLSDQAWTRVFDRDPDGDRPRGRG